MQTPNITDTDRNYRMHCGFTDAKFLRRFPHCRICCDHEFRHFHRPFFDICLQTKHSSKYRLVMYMLGLGRICITRLSIRIIF